ncbi:MAG: hypothetical protein M3552_09545 [Planctomycetota bacterium]|nr:hypothetical protein [Planctomycetaceae bacterium]MDQ3330883.1 hypothetical protein [Planctomycetota bacterium]
MSEGVDLTKRHRRGQFWAGLAVRLAGLGLIWIGDGHNSPFRKGLVIAGVVLSVGGIAVLRYLLLVPVLSRLRTRHELPPGNPTTAPQRPFWKRKRWIAAAVLWLVFAYPVSVGPAVYANGRGWLPASVVSHLEVIYEPLDLLIMNDLPGSGPLSRYTVWLGALAKTHAASH